MLTKLALCLYYPFLAPLSASAHSSFMPLVFNFLLLFLVLFIAVFKHRSDLRGMAFCSCYVVRIQGMMLNVSEDS